MMPRKPEDLDLLLVRHYGLMLDNLSALNADTCDRLAGIVTGGKIEKRTLHTDLEVTELDPQGIIFFNGIGSLHSRPDLTERTIVIELERIPKKERIDDVEFESSFQEAVPEILGGIFALLCRAMDLYPDVNLAELPRMASFAKWGYAIAEAMGGRGDEFMAQYNNNSSLQTGALIERDTLFSAIIEAMDNPELRPLTGGFGEVLKVLAKVADPDGEQNNYRALDKDRMFPKPQGFANRLERIRIPLEEMGITFEIDKHRTSKAKARVTFYRKAGQNTIDAVSSF